MTEQGGEFVLDANLGQLGKQAGLSVLGDGNLVRLELEGGDVPGDLAAAVQDQVGLVANDGDDGGLAATPRSPGGLVGLDQVCTCAHSRIRPLPPCPGHLKKNKSQGDAPVDKNNFDVNLIQILDPDSCQRRWDAPP